VNRTRGRTTLFALTACLAMAAHVADGQASTATPAEARGPSLDETMTFLKNFLQGSGFVDYDGRIYPFRTVTANGCVMQLLAQQHMSGAPDYYRYDLDLKTLDPLGLKSDTGVVYIETQGLQPTIGIEYGEDNGTVSGTNRAGRINIHVSGGEASVSRVMRALKHALELCGAKVSPF
jgi:hypothetical protein